MTDTQIRTELLAIQVAMDTGNHFAANEMLKSLIERIKKTRT